MSARFLAMGGVCVAVALGGCSLTPTSSSNTSGFTGASANVASVLNLLSSDGSSTNGADICKNVLAAALVSALDKAAKAAVSGGTCATAINDQLKTVDDFSLTIKTIKITGTTARAQVQTVYLGKKVYSYVSLVKQPAGWRVASISGL